ncbi:MAG: hypothetical protein R6U36_02710 [Candidatus Fermentibacteraceae bacterium]
MSGRRGAALAMAFALGMVLFVLVGAAFVLFRTNAESYSRSRRRLQSLKAAEAGAMLSMHALAAEPGLIEGLGPFRLEMEGDSAGWIELPGSGDRVRVVVDPSNSSGERDNGLVEIRSRGMSGGLTRDVVIRAAQDYPSRYILLCDDDLPRSLLTDGYHLDGPLHCNGRIHFSSSTPDSTGDPYVSRVSTTEEGGIYFADCGRASVPHPPGSAVWVRPYATLRQGRPYWSDCADSVSFGLLEERFLDNIGRPPQGEAISFSGGGRLLLDGEWAYLKGGPEEPADTMSLRGISILVHGSSFNPLYVKTRRRPESALTIYSRSDIYIAGQVDGPTVSTGGPLALVTMGDIVVARDPDLYGQTDWPDPWDIETDGNLGVRAVLAAPDGALRAQDPGALPRMRRLSVTGSLIQRRFGRTGSFGSGYDLRLTYDRGLAGVHPPGFPPLGRWMMLSWRQDADYGDGSMEDDMF